MAIRFYHVPEEMVVNGADFYFKPKYFSSVPPPEWRAISYGKEGSYLVRADVTAVEHAAINANADVTAIPANLADTIGGALTTVQTKLEAANLPSHWVTSEMTWRTFVVWVWRFFELQQLFLGVDWAANRLFIGDITLSSTVGDLTPTIRQRLNAGAQRRGLNTSSIGLSTTIRNALVILGQQLPAPVEIMGEAF
jgi:hypothetical protein